MSTGMYSADADSDRECCVQIIARRRFVAAAGVSLALARPAPLFIPKAKKSYSGWMPRDNHASQPCFDFPTSTATLLPPQVWLKASWVQCCSD